jgi:hypothetical protein
MKHLETWENVLSVTDVSFAVMWSVIHRRHMLITSTPGAGVIFYDLHKMNHRHFNKRTEIRKVHVMTII